MSYPTQRHSALKRRILQLHESSYLSLMSIVQGVALSFLAFTIYEFRAGYGVAEWLQSLTALLLIIVVWNEYVVGVASFVWIPNLLDAALPFLLCVAELLLAATISGHMHHWYTALATFGAMSMVAFLNMYWQARQFVENDSTMQALGALSAVSMLLVMGITLQAGLFALASYYLSSWVFPVMTLLAITAYLIRTIVYWERVKGAAMLTRRKTGCAGVESHKVV